MRLLNLGRIKDEVDKINLAVADREEYCKEWEIKNPPEAISDFGDWIYLSTERPICTMYHQYSFINKVTLENKILYLRDIKALKSAGAIK